jgi:hypothetical protein
MLAWQCLTILRVSPLFVQWRKYKGNMVEYVRALATTVALDQELAFLSLVIKY